MALEGITTTQINGFVKAFVDSETARSITPINNSKSKYSNISSAYSTITTKLNSLKTLLSSMVLSDSSSLFQTKSAVSSNSSFLTATASSSASSSIFDLRINQLAKNDILLTSDLSSSAANNLTGTHSFVIKTGDGEGGEFLSKINVDFTGTETNKTVIEKIQAAINSDKAVINSSTKSGNYTGGVTSFKINFNGTETSIDVAEGGTYEEKIDSIISQVSSKISGVTAEKVKDASGNVNLKFTVNDSSKYISITNSGSFDIVSDLGIAATKEKGASGLVSASSIAPSSGLSQLSLTAKKTGIDFRIKEISDASGSTALSSIGLNLGASRPQFSQNDDPDSAGFMYSDISSTTSLLNAKVTFNGLQIQRSTNTISDLVEGVTFDLKAVMKDTDTNVSVSVTNDTKSVKTKLEEFITKFNDVYNYLKTNSTSTKEKRGTLAGDSNAQALLSLFSSNSYTQVSGLPSSDITFLSQIGISFSTSTGLSISDSSKLEKKLSEEPGKVEALFNSTEGIASKLLKGITPYLGAEGFIQKSKNSADNYAKSLSDRVDSAQKRIDKAALSLRTRYEKLQAQLAELLTTQSFFSY